MGKFEAKTFLLKIVLLDEVIRTFSLEREMPMMGTFYDMDITNPSFGFSIINLYDSLYWRPH